MTNKRLFKAWAITIASLMAVFVSVMPQTTFATTPVPWTANLTGTPTSPQAFCSAEFDCVVHEKSPYADLTADRMDAVHGADCGAPPASHNINQYADFIFLCNNHVMTASNSGGYAETALTPAQLIDISGGTTATVSYNVSTLRLSPRDWYDVTLTPYGDNLVTPISPCCNGVDLQGPPKNGIDFKLENRPGCAPAPTCSAFSLFQYNNFVSTQYPISGGVLETRIGGGSASVRTPFQIIFSSGHVKFQIPFCPMGQMGCNGSGTTGCPAQGCAAYPFYDLNLTTTMTATQYVFQIAHHSYHPGKSCDDLGQVGPYTYVNPPAPGYSYQPQCAPNTWHWSGISIDRAIPFTLDKATPSLIGPYTNPAGTVTSVTLGTPSPSNGFLRFSGLGTITVSFDGGATYQPATRQAQQLNDSLKFSSFWMAIPAGVSVVYFNVKPAPPNNLPAGMLRDITVWAN